MFLINNEKIANVQCDAFCQHFIKRKLNDNIYNNHKEPRLETHKKVQWLKAPTQQLSSSNAY